MIVIFNPAAGNRRVHRLWQVLDILSTSGVRVQLRETAHPGHATEIARREAASGATLIVAAGGDGTIAEVAAGLAGGGAALGIIPLGTANVLAQELSVPFLPRDVAAALAFRRTRRLWPGVATSAAGSTLFVQMLGVGLDAQVVHKISKPLKRVLGRGAYVAQTLREAMRYNYRPIRLKLDGVEMAAESAVISKGCLYAGHYLLAPDARPGEPGFSVALFGAGGAGAALMYGAALTLNMLPQAPGMRLLRAREIEVLNTDDLPAQADGDPAGRAPLIVRDAPAPLDIVVS